jgi:hypothetical protein
MFKLSIQITRIPQVLLPLILASAISSVSASSLPTTELLPIVAGKPEIRSTPFIAWFQDLSLRGYIEEEYSVSGFANIYGYRGDSSQSPGVEVIKAGIPYTSRMLLRRPEQPAEFSGTVYLEVLNATAGWDGDPIWQSNHEYMIRKGAAWVGVTAKPVTVDFLRDGWGTWSQATRNASRYRALSMPHFGQVWDMLGQIGLLLKTAQSNGNPLSRFKVKKLIMVGYSQSADYQVTFANSFHSGAMTPAGVPVYDGYYISAGRVAAKHVTGPTDTTPEELAVDDRRNLIRVEAPVIRFQTQTEVIGFESYRVRQSEAEYPLLRFYEMAGGSHVDAELNSTGGQALVRDLGLPPSFCPEPENPYNPIRIAYVQSALLEALNRWISDGASPPASRYLEVAQCDGSTKLVLDSNGNAVGGVRPPEVTVPKGAYLGHNSGEGFCYLYGGFVPFGKDKLESLYPGQDAYKNQMMQAIQRSVNEGFLLTEDAEAQRETAAASRFGK